MRYLFLIALMGCVPSPSSTRSNEWNSIESPVPGYECYEYSTRGNGYDSGRVGVECFPTDHVFPNT